MMRPKRLVPIFAIAASAGAFLACGCASPTAKAPAAGRTSAGTPSTAGGPAGPQASTARGPVQISSYSGNDGPKSAVVLTGVIGDFGSAVRTSANGKKDSQLVLALTHGSFRLSIAGIESTLVSAFSHFPSDTRTCSGIVTATGTAPVVAGSATGAYQRISGTFRMTITINEVDSWPKCRALLAQTIYIAGVGAVSFS